MGCVIVSSTGLHAELLAGFLAQCAQVPIVAVCDSAAAAIAAIDHFRPTLVILDGDGNGGCEECERIARHVLHVCGAARLILLSPAPRLDPLLRELAPVMDRIESLQALLQCVRARFESAGRPSGGVDPLPAASCFNGLRPRERSVLDLVGSGLGSREIARTLGVSVQTVATYRKSISARLGVSGARLVRIAVLYSWVFFVPLRLPPRRFDGQGDGTA